MSDGFAGRLTASLQGGIGRKLFALLVGLLLSVTILLSFVFYLEARSVALGQLEESYSSLAITVASLSRYDFQFHKTGLKTTLDALVRDEPNMLWMEYASADGHVIEAGGPLGKAPYGTLSAATKQVAVTTVDMPGGGILIRAPILTAPAAPTGSAAQGPSAPGATQEQLLGEVRVVVSLRSLVAMRHKFLAFGAIVLLICGLVGTLLSMAMTRYAVGSIQGLTAYAEQIAAGNLAVSRGRFSQTDEIGRLGTSFQTMSANLVLMIRQVRDAFQRVEEGKEILRRQLASTLENTREQEAGGLQLSMQATSIQRAVGEISSLMESLSQLAEEVSSSVLEMIASIDEIAGNTEGLSEAVHTAASTLAQNVAAIREIDSSVETLNRFVEETSAAIHEMEGNIRQIEENAGETRRATELVATEAQSGAKAMEHSTASIQKLQASFESTTTVMRLLGQRSEEVGNILSVIDEVMEQTHLLALNAAIIAAQAGEHGRSFAVVAGEIKELAGKTSISTREIASLIEAVQRDVQQAIDAVASQRALVETSVAMSGEAARVFDRIQGAVRPSLQMVQEIARATTEQARGSVSIVRATEQLRDLAHSLRRGTKEQTLGSEQILEAVNRIRSLSEEMRRATGEQSAGSAIIRQAMDRLTTAVGEVMNQIQIQSRASAEVEKVMDTFSTTSTSNVANIQEASGQVEVLASRAEEVARVLSRFHLEGG